MNQLRYQNTLAFFGCALALGIAFSVTFAGGAQAQTFTVLHDFSGSDGAIPGGALTIDRAGNVYGTTAAGGENETDCNGGCGTVFKLLRSGSGWVLNPLYRFRGYSEGDGQAPLAGVIFGPDGSLYGATNGGGIIPAGGYGTVFRLRPPPTACVTVLCSWSETLLYSFTTFGDGNYPGSGTLAFDTLGNIYGTTPSGGGGLCNDFPCGTLYAVSPENGIWVETIVHNFGDDLYARNPNAGMILDSLGNLYSGAPGPNGGIVYEVTPQGQNSPDNILYSLSSNGNVEGGLIFDHSGNLYGTTADGGTGGGGIVFELVPSGSDWNLTVLHNFAYSGDDSEPGSWASLTMDAAGNLYGTTVEVGAHNCGSVFRLAPSNGNWVFTSLHDFTCGADGAYPGGGVVLDAAGNIYGAASEGGTLGMGVIFEIAP
jgi:uncharacterized repeat protein (TIGR03803 family)